MGKLSNLIKKHPKVLELATSRNFIQLALDGIRRERSHGPDSYDPDSPLKIQALIHKIILTGDWASAKHDYKNVIWKIFGELYKDNDYKREARKSLYKERWFNKTGDFLINIYLFPEPRHRPPFRMEIHVSEHVKIEGLKGLLLRIMFALPTAKVSEIDYTLDQYCYSRHEVQNLYWVEMRNLYVPHQREVKMKGADPMERGDDNRMNMAYRAVNIQVYERGPDKKKKNAPDPDDKNKKIGYWQFEDVDRVRLEYTAKRVRLRANSIDTIGDLVKRPRFQNVNKNIYRFKSYYRGSKLPLQFEDYTTPDTKGNYGSFLLEHNQHRGRKDINVRQNMANVEGFYPLKARLEQVMEEYDIEWRKTK